MAMTSSIFVQQLLQAPIYLIWLAAIVLAAVTWRRHPRVSLLAIAGLALFFVRAGIEGGLSRVDVHDTRAGELC